MALNREQFSLSHLPSNIPPSIRSGNKQLLSVPVVEDTDHALVILIQRTPRKSLQIGPRSLKENIGHLSFALCSRGHHGWEPIPIRQPITGQDITICGFAPQFVWRHFKNGSLEYIDQNIGKQERLARLCQFWHSHDGGITDYSERTYRSSIIVPTKKQEIRNFAEIIQASWSGLRSYRALTSWEHEDNNCVTCPYNAAAEMGIHIPLKPNKPWPSEIDEAIEQHVVNCDISQEGSPILVPHHLTRWQGYAAKTGLVPIYSRTDLAKIIKAHYQATANETSHNLSVIDKLSGLRLGARAKPSTRPVSDLAA